MSPMNSEVLRATGMRARGSWQGTPQDCIVLDFDERHRRRTAMTGVKGTHFLLDLAEAVALRGGDALVLDTGGLIEIVASPEPLAEITAPDPASLVRIAWHLGNRHLPVQLMGKRLRIRRDHVIEEMVHGLGGQVRAIEAPFDPEGGAYAGAGDVHHDHGHGHGHGSGAHDHHGHHHDHG
jgi:urease accessory protein